MAVKLRLMRMGAKKKPTYRIVATDSRRKRDGQYIELIGTYEPIKDSKININGEKRTKEKSHITIPKVLHKLIDIFKLLYELCVWIKAIIKIFF